MLCKGFLLTNFNFSVAANLQKILDNPEMKGIVFALVGLMALIL